MSTHDFSPADPAYQQAVADLERLAAAGTLASMRSASPAAPAAQDESGLARTQPDQPTTSRTALTTVWSEKTHRDLLEALPDAMVVIDSDGFMVLVNEQTERMFGYHREEMLGQPIEILVPERVRRQHITHRRHFFTRPESRPMGVHLRLFGQRKDGSLFPVEISLSPIRTEQGILAASVIRDITQRERQEAKFRTLVENIPAVTFIAPLDESVPELYVSPQIEELLGFTQKEWVEDPVLWHRQLHPEDRDRWNRQFAPTCASGEPFRSTYRFMAKDGRVVWVHGSARMVRDAEGKLLFLQGVAFDVTPIKEAEETLREAKEALHQVNADLERRVQERTEQLNRSMAELQEKTEELEQFAYVASHDLREPLRTLVNWPQLLAKQYKGRLDEQADGWINRIIGGAERMRRLIDDLSQYARVLRRDRAFAPVDCALVAREAYSNLQAAIEESGALVVLRTLPVVQGNQQQLMLLFQNLIGNAIKFRDPERPVRVEVDSRPHEIGWELWVKDNGIGIEARYLERIFGLGERLHSASKYAGTGFGLAICEKIVAGHGGCIKAESVPGQGSTFFFTLRSMQAPLEQ
jgi:PAS domain S-box-containing protein